MTEHYAGGCACGALRYEISGQPIAQLHCQCRDCQRRSGTGHASYLVFAEHRNAMVIGKATTWRVRGDSGNVKAHAFCPDCGSPVYLTFEATPDLIAVHAASLDDPRRFQPQVVTYGAGAQAWDLLDTSLQVFDSMPGS